MIVDPFMSVLTDPAALPLLPPSSVAAFGRTLVVAPHPDDETLGCGGAIALLHATGVAVRVLVVSDGTQSHPHSRRYPAPALRALRESETREALATLGIGGGAATFLAYTDRAVPDRGAAGFAAAVKQCWAFVDDYRPATIFVPWRRDPHPDHRAANSLIVTASATLHPAPRIIEYPIWTWQIAEPGDAPTQVEAEAWRLDIGPVLACKQAAVLAYRSQTTDLIDDDPEGFRLTPDMLAHFAVPYEVYVESRR